jgi:hypothetical protein
VRGQSGDIHTRYGIGLRWDGLGSRMPNTTYQTMETVLRLVSVLGLFPILDDSESERNFEQECQ